MVGEPKPPGRFNTLISTFAAVVSTLGAALGIYISWQQTALKERQEAFSRELDGARQRLASQVEDRTRLENRQRFYLELEEKLLLPAISAGDLPRQRVALAFVQSLEDSEFRRAFLGLLQSDQARPEVQAVAGRVLLQEDRFDDDTRGRAEQRVAAAPPPVAPVSGGAAPTPAGAPPDPVRSLSIPGEANGWDFDVFWCERGGNAAMDQAAAAMRIIDRSMPGHGLIRVRLLPDSINQQPGYRIGGYVIRREDTPDERAKATELRRALDGNLGGAVFAEQLSSQTTRFYLSVFVCPGIAASSR